MQTPIVSLEGRNVLVTGASSGLGAHFAEAAARAGACVILAARRVDRLEEIKSAIDAAGGRALAVEMDVTDERSIIDAVTVAEQSAGPIMSVVANAGLNVAGSALSLPADEFDHITNVNLRGVFLTAREAARRMIKAGSETNGQGRIVLIGSVASHRVVDKLVAYNTTKAGVMMMGKALAKEWANKGINVNVVCPGWISTEINQDWLASPAGQSMIADLPRRRVMQADDLSDIVLHLLSDRARAITGGSFEIDDGQSL